MAGSSYHRQSWKHRQLAQNRAQQHESLRLSLKPWKNQRTHWWQVPWRTRHGDDRDMLCEVCLEFRRVFPYRFLRGLEFWEPAHWLATPSKTAHLRARWTSSYNPRQQRRRLLGYQGSRASEARRTYSACPNGHTRGLRYYLSNRYFA